MKMNPIRTFTFKDPLKAQKIKFPSSYLKTRP